MSATFADAGPSSQFYGDCIMVDATATTAYPVWSDTRDAALFLCPGIGHPPQLCHAATNASGCLVGVH